MKKKIYISSPEETVAVLGEGDKNIKILEKMYNVKIFYGQDSNTNGCIINIIGNPSGVKKTYYKLQELKNKTSKIQPQMELTEDAVYLTFSNKLIKPQSENQKKYVEAIKKNDIVIAIGPAGTGKTFLAVATALNLFSKGNYSRIVLSRPVVEAGEKLGFLPGDLYEKVNPYLRPLYDAFFTMLGAEKFRRYKEDGIIEIVPLAYMRGRTIEDAFMILDEAQNTVPEQMKMFLTRIGPNSKVVVTGDITQIDLEKKEMSGLVLSQKILRNIKGIKFCYFTEADVVRHKIVKEIIKAYERWTSPGRQAERKRC